MRALLGPAIRGGRLRFALANRLHSCLLFFPPFLFSFFKSCLTLVQFGEITSPRGQREKPVCLKNKKKGHDYFAEAVLSIFSSKRDKGNKYLKPSGDDSEAIMQSLDTFVSGGHVVIFTCLPLGVKPFFSSPFHSGWPN